MKNTPLSSSTPILSMQRDIRLGESPGGWSLYQSLGGWTYIGCTAPGEEEYILPLRADLIETLCALFSMHALGDSEDAVEELATDLEEHEDSIDYDNADANEDDFGSAEWDGVDGGESANPDFLSLRPGRDRVTGYGEGIIGYVTPFGAPYFQHGDYCVACDAPPYRIAFGLLNTSDYAGISTDATNLEQPKIHLRQGDIQLTFHLVHYDGEAECSDGVIHATPLTLQGIHNGKRLHLSLQP